MTRNPSDFCGASPAESSVSGSGTASANPIRMEVSMALIGANELKKKMLIEIDGQPYNVLEVFFATPTARGASTMVRTRLKNLLNGSVLEKSFKTSEKFAEPDVQLAAVSFLYN